MFEAAKLWVKAQISKSPHHHLLSGIFSRAVLSEGVLTLYIYLTLNPSPEGGRLSSIAEAMVCLRFTEEKIEKIA